MALNLCFKSIRNLKYKKKKKIIENNPLLWMTQAVFAAPSISYLDLFLFSVHFLINDLLQVLD